MAKPSFKYRGRSDESVMRRAKESAGSFDSYVKGDFLWYKSKEGENSIRIMPRSPNEDFDKWGDHWGIDIYLHYSVGPDNGTYLCSDKMLGEPCAVCEAKREIEDQDEADKLKWSRRILCWLIDRSDEKTGPKLWSMPHGTSKDVSAVSQVKGTGEILLIDHPEEGFDVYFDREGEKMRTKYKRVEVARDSSPLSDNEKQQLKWLGYVTENPLSEILEFFPFDHIEKVLFGQGSSKKDRGDEAPSRGASRRGGRADADEEDTGRGGSRRGGVGSAGDDDEAPPARSRRGGREEPEEEPETRRGSRRGEPEADDPPRRGRVRDEEPESEADDPPPRRGRATKEDSEEEGEKPRSRRGEPEKEAEDDPPPRGRTERVRAKPEPEEEPEKEADEDTSAKGRLSRLGRRRS